MRGMINNFNFLECYGKTCENVFFTALFCYLNNRVFLSRNYRLIVASVKFDVLKTKYLPEKQSLEGKYAGTSMVQWLVLGWEFNQ